MPATAVRPWQAADSMPDHPWALERLWITHRGCGRKAASALADAVCCAAPLVALQPNVVRLPLFGQQVCQNFFDSCSKLEVHLATA